MSWELVRDFEDDLIMRILPRLPTSCIQCHAVDEVTTLTTARSLVERRALVRGKLDMLVVVVVVVWYGRAAVFEVDRVGKV